MRQRTIDEPQTIDEVLTELSRLGWDRAGVYDGLITLRRGTFVREMEADDLAAFLAAGAPNQEPVNLFAVASELRRHGPMTRIVLKQRLSREYDCTTLAGLLRQMTADGDIVFQDGVYAQPEPEL